MFEGLEGVELTNAWIDHWQVQDSNGTKHKPSGLLTSEARLVIYVNFDNHPVIGRRIWCFLNTHFKILIAAKMRLAFAPTYGFSPRSSTSKTGAGVLIAPHEIRLDRVDKLDPGIIGEGGSLAEEIVGDWLRKRQNMGHVRRATLNEQKSMGIDWVADDPKRRYGVNPLLVEVKSRGQNNSRYDKIFAQVSETNPDKLWD